ncbi:MAG: ATP-dependent helicase HrpB [Ilumatobacteraceae bacterium]
MSPASVGADLPIAAVIDDIVSTLVTARRLLIIAPPGAGKTTLVPLRLSADPRIDGRVLVLEPRRLATRAAATRMANMLGESVGDSIGYTTRDERRTGPRTRVEVVTEGILTRRIQNDPELPGISAVIFDEVHERHLTTDLGLALTLEVADSIRPDLIVGAMSATPDVDRLRRVLGECPVIESDGRLHPVEIIWAPGGDTRSPDRRRDIARSAASTVLRALTEQDGDVLVFLPGIGEIRRTADELAAMIGPGIDVMPLAGSVSIEEQDAALASSPAGRRRVVLATDIAESSLTVEGIRVVVDSGLARVPRHDARSQMTRLVTITASRASADQRAGRAGRVAPGSCYRMWSAIEHGSRSAHRAPEIADADLAGLLLETTAWGTPISEMRLVNQPSSGQLKSARALLTDLSAIDGDDQLTEIGRRMLQLPLHPRLAAMVIDHPDTLSVLMAALLDERDVFTGRLDERPTDLSERIRVLVGQRRGASNVDRGAVHRVIDRARDLARRIEISFDLESVDEHECGARLLSAYPDRLAGRRRRAQFQMRTGTAAWIPESDPLCDAELIVAADLDGRRDRARIRLGASIELAQVLEVFDRAGREGLMERRRLEWDAERDDLVAVVDRRLGSIRFQERRERPTPSNETSAALIHRVKATGLAVLAWSSTARRLRDRVMFMHHRHGEPWPDWSPETLIATIDDWLLPYLHGCTGRADLESLDLAMLLRASLRWPLGAEIDDIAPDHLTLPSGRRASLDYVDGVGDPRPFASVRVQDLFGLRTHPEVDGVPVTLHLLSPADRPIQITSDLPSFWSGSWEQVRKEMAGRYPKHHWPTDPSSADPRRLGRDDRP